MRQAESSQPRVWFITGASSGFGRHLTELVLSLGEIVVATLRTPSAIDDLKTKYPASRLLIVKLDTCKPSDIKSAFDLTKQTFGRCDVVFNNAGTAVFGEVEAADEDTMRRLFDVNFWGAANVSKEAVKFFREVNPPGVGGTLLVVSSVVGLAATAVMGYYSASKYALEAITDALAQELDPDWKIKVCLLEPGQFNTNVKHTAAWSPETAPPAYSNPSLLVHRMRAWGTDPNMRQPGDPVKAIARIVELVDAIDKGEDVPLRCAIGKDTIKLAREKMESMQVDMQKSERWSEDLLLDTK